MSPGPILRCPPSRSAGRRALGGRWVPGDRSVPGGPADGLDQVRAAKLAELISRMAAVGEQSDSLAERPVAPLPDGLDPKQVTEARNICLRLLAVAPRPRAGLAQALQRKEIPDDVAQAVLDRLTEVGLIDDVAYAHSFVRVKQRDRALGRTKLRTELRRLGVDEDIMAAAVQTVDPEAERARAVELIDKRIDATMAAGPVAARRRLLGLLDRRGYPAEIAIAVVEDALSGYADQVDHWS